MGAANFLIEVTEQYGTTETQTQKTARLPDTVDIKQRLQEYFNNNWRTDVKQHSTLEFQDRDSGNFVEVTQITTVPDEDYIVLSRYLHDLTRHLSTNPLGYKVVRVDDGEVAGVEGSSDGAEWRAETLTEETGEKYTVSKIWTPRINAAELPNYPDSDGTPAHFPPTLILV